MKLIKGVLRGVDWVEEIIIILLMTFMITLNFVNVVSRRVFSASLSFTEELTIIAFVWITMIGIAAAYKRMSHLGMSFLVERFGPRGQAIFAVIGMICSLILIAVMILYGVQMVQTQIAMNAKTPALMIPAWVQGCCVPIGGVFMAIRTVQAYGAEIAKLWKSKKEIGGIA